MVGDDLELGKLQQSICKGSAVRRYRYLAIGRSGAGYLFSYELYELLLSGVPGALGLGLRRFVVPRLCGNRPKGLVVGSRVSLRNPREICLGDNVVIEQDVSIEARCSFDGSESGRVEIGDSVFIGRDSLVFSKGTEVVLERGVNIGSCCRISSEASIRIGESSLIAAYCYIGPGNHNMDAPGAVIAQGMEEAVGVEIGRGCWLGARVTVVDGVKIGDGAVVGAHSLVLEDIPPGAVAVGSPARVVRYREGFEDVTTSTC